MKNIFEKNKYILPIYATIAAFSTYFSMYAFRKPFSAATYEGLELWGIDYKIVLVIAQVLGYTISKFVGIKVISEMPAHRRSITILIFIGISWLSLLFLGFVPYPYNFVFMFINGLPLGMIWGLVFAYLEGRRYTEVLAAGLSASFIVSSGVVKSVGKYLMSDWNIQEFWMPFYTGLIFIPILLLSVFLLSKIPAPSESDKKLRQERVPMSRADRRKFFKRYAFGLVSLIIIYAFLTIFRDFRDNFAADIWIDLGYGGDYGVFTRSEIPVAFGVLIALGATMIVKNNKKALWLNHLIISIGIILIGTGTLAFVYNMINPFVWMILMGLGLYLGYVPYNSMLFERLVAVTGEKGNAGYLIYVADAFGYLGSVLILLYKNFWFKDMSYGNFFISSGYIISVVSIILLLFSWLFFRKSLR